MLADQDVGDRHGRTLCAVGGGGIGELDVGTHVLRRQHDDCLTAYLLTHHFACTGLELLDRRSMTQ
ncbi:hypothetical protein [Georgenia muralis]